MRISAPILAMLLLASLSFAADDVVTGIHGTVTKVDATAKTVAIKTADGTEHTVEFVGKTTVHGTDAGAKDTFHGIKEGSEVVAHYTEKGTKKTAVEVDQVGKDGLHATTGTVSAIDRGTKTIAVKTADGTEQTFQMADHAAVDGGKGIAKGAEKTAKVTVYYTEVAGKRVAHFFEKQ